MRLSEIVSRERILFPWRRKRLEEAVGLLFHRLESTRALVRGPGDSSGWRVLLRGPG